MENNYNTNFISTYKQFEDIEDSNICYKLQLLQAFNINNYNEDILQKKMENIYNILRDNKYLKEIFLLLEKKHPQLKFINYNIKNLENFIYLLILFSYDYFYIFHRELCYFSLNKDYNFKDIKNHII